MTKLGGRLNGLMIVIVLHFRVCMVAKPLAVCAKEQMDTCVVVDSGAFSTSVAVVLNGQVVPERWQLIPVGGWHVAENLKQAMQWQPEEYTEVCQEQAVTVLK
jgi:actin-related protein